MKLLTPEELVEVGFGRSQVVMANEGHHGLRRCVRTREIGRRLLPVAHRLGVRHFAMEALWDRGLTARANRERRLPPSEGYLGQPDMRRLVQDAFDLGMTLVAYEAEHDVCGLDPLGVEATNRRELEQARNLAAALPDGPLLVWCGNGHLSKWATSEWQPMGVRFRELTGIDAFAMDQTLTVAFDGEGLAPWVEPHRDALEAHGDTAGFLAGDGPGCFHFDWADAYVLSLDNELT